MEQSRPVGAGAFYAPGVSADSEARRRLRRAYEEAWAARPTSGDSDEVLRARLSAHGLSEVLDETTAIHQFVFEFWRRKVPPRRLGLEALKVAGRSARDLIAVYRSVVRTLRSAASDEESANRQGDLEEMPEDKEGVLDNYDRPASTSLTFVPADNAAPMLSYYADITDGRGGWHQPCVWFDMHPAQPRASVLLGDTVIGEAAVPVGIWEVMRGLASKDLYADGVLDFRIRNELLETGTLVCYYPAD